MPEGKPFRVLSLDGGGMRGTYTATYLSRVAETFAKRRGVPALDIGKAFDLIVGTSTGGIVACALAAGVPMSDVVRLYKKHGRAIFPWRLPSSVGIGLMVDLFGRPEALEHATKALQEALIDRLGNATLSSVYEQRGIALAITAIELGQHRSWVFKTPHLSTTNHRDDGYRLVDVCLATSAAPIYRSLAAIDHPDHDSGEHNVFADGGLWANNPVLVGLIEALELTEKGRRIEIFCMGTCPRPAGENVPKSAVNRGLLQWRFGGLAASLSIDAQEFAYDKMARQLAKHIDRECEIVRFPSEKIPADLMKFLDIDDSRQEAIGALINQARSDADMTNSRCNDGKDRDGQLIKTLFCDAPATSPAVQKV
jgi:hypothetical protein